MILLSWMLYAVVVGILLGAAAWLAERGLLAIGRPVRGVWALALAGAVILPSLTPWLAGPSGTMPSTDEVPVVQAFPDADRTDLESTLIPALLRPLEWTSDLVQAAAGKLNQGTVLVTDFTLGLFPVQPPDRLFGVLWGIGSALLLLLSGSLAFRLQSRLHRWPRVRLHGVTVRVAPGLGPAVAGAIRPSIVLPRWSLELPGPDLRTVLLHETEHLRARDTLLLGIAGILTLGFFWNPAVWWILGRLRAAVEVDCDRRVLGHGVSPAGYGSLLLDVSVRGRTPTLAIAALSEAPTLLERRLKQMRSDKLAHPRLAAGAASVTAVLLLAVACETEGPAPMEPSLPSEVTVSPESASEDPSVAGPLAHRLLVEPTPNEPLIFVDGIRVSDRNVLSHLDPDQITRVEIRKGAAAQGIEGMEADAPGVILITTKDGSEP